MTELPGIAEIGSPRGYDRGITCGARRGIPQGQRRRDADRELSAAASLGAPRTGATGLLGQFAWGPPNSLSRKDVKGEP